MTAADLSPAERAVVDRFEAAEPAPESLTEQVAVGIFYATEAAEYQEWPDVAPRVQHYCRTLADAAIAVMRGEP